MVMVMVLVVEVSPDTSGGSVDQANVTRCGRKVLFVQLTGARGGAGVVKYMTITEIL